MINEIGMKTRLPIILSNLEKLKPNSLISANKPYGVSDFNNECIRFHPNHLSILSLNS